MQIMHIMRKIKTIIVYTKTNGITRIVKIQYEKY